MSDKTTLRNFWIILFASIALLTIILALADASLKITVDENAGEGVRATIPSNTPLSPVSQPVPWYERAVSGLIGFLLAAILSGRFMLLAGVLLFYGFIISYIAPNAWQKIRGRLWSTNGKTAEESALNRRKRE